MNWIIAFYGKNDGLVFLVDYTDYKDIKWMAENLREQINAYMRLLKDDSYGVYNCKTKKRIGTVRIEKGMPTC